MKDKPLVSIIALCFNQAKYCEETLDSIVSQSYQNIEIIIIDDCSHDNSKNIIDDWVIQQDKLPITFIKNETNQGICSSINSGIALCRGEYISLIACDDIMMPLKISKQILLLSKSDKSFFCVYSDSQIINDKSIAQNHTWFDICHYKIKENQNAFNKLLSTPFLQLQTQLIRASTLKKIGLFDPLLSFEDLDFNLRACRRFKILYSDYISIKYRRHSQNTTKYFSSKHYKSYVFIMKKHLGYSKQTDVIIKNNLTNKLLQAFKTKILLGVENKEFTLHQLPQLSLSSNIKFIIRALIHNLLFAIKPLVNKIIYPKKIFKYTEAQQHK